MATSGPRPRRRGPWSLLACLALLAVAASGCGPAGKGPAHLPWSRGRAIAVGVVGWWNSATVRGAGQPAALGRALAGATSTGCGSAAPAGAYTLRPVLSGGRLGPTLSWSGGQLWVGACTYSVPGPALWILQAVTTAARQAWSGQLLRWPAVAAAFPVGARATLIDWATGRSLTVRRWGGRLHADVEPATAGDAVTLQAIYGGRWSWARRPVLVVLPDGVRVAASMNGMPHGGGAVTANAFAGHFCLHFLGSAVHRSGRIDPAHLLAILTAAGLTVAPTQEAAPAAAGPLDLDCT